MPRGIKPKKTERESERDSRTFIYFSSKSPQLARNKALYARQQSIPLFGEWIAKRVEPLSELFLPVLLNLKRDSPLLYIHIDSAKIAFQRFSQLLSATVLPLLKSK